MNKANNLNSSGKSTANLDSFKYQSCNFWTDRTNKEKLLIKNKNMSMKKLFISVETQQRKNCEFEIFLFYFFIYFIYFLNIKSMSSQLNESLHDLFEKLKVWNPKEYFSPEFQCLNVSMIIMIMLKWEIFFV